MSNDDSNVKLREEEIISLKTKRKSLMNQLAVSLCEAGIDAKVIKKIKYQ